MQNNYAVQLVPLNSTWLTSQNGTVFIQEQNSTDSKRWKDNEHSKSSIPFFDSTWFSNKLNQQTKFQSFGNKKSRIF